MNFKLKLWGFKLRSRWLWCHC